jgi:hypothetical protein
MFACDSSCQLEYYVSNHATLRGCTMYSILMGTTQAWCCPAHCCMQSTSNLPLCHHNDHTASTQQLSQRLYSNMLHTNVLTKMCARNSW